MRDRRGRTKRTRRNTYRDNNDDENMPKDEKVKITNGRTQRGRETIGDNQQQGTGRQKHCKWRAKQLNTQQDDKVKTNG